ncbi:MAG: GIY-YIG nuclease family protein [Microvirga sp.]
MRAWRHIDHGRLLVLHSSLCGGSYYVGTSRSDDLETRISQHDQGTFGGYTANRRPVALVYSAHFNQITDAIA